MPWSGRHLATLWMALRAKAGAYMWCVCGHLSFSQTRGCTLCVHLFASSNIDISCARVRCNTILHEMQVWRHQSDSKSVDCDQEHDIEAIDSVQIEGVECVFQIERDSALEAQYSDGDTQDDRGVFLAVNDPQGRALLQSLVEGLQEDPGLLNHRRILLPRAVYTY